MSHLAEDQIAAWHRDGFLHPFGFLNEDELVECRAGLDRYEAFLGAPVNGSRDLKFRTMIHIILPWVAAIATDRRITDKVSDLIGPDLLLFTSTFFIKEPGSPMVAAWHQDSTYYGILPHEVVTVWVALSDASTEAGCMEALSWNSTPRLMHHAAGVVENSVNRAAQIIVEPLDDDHPVAMPLKAGQFSMHHGLSPHRSAPNRSNHRRIGLGLNYIPASSKPAGARRTGAMLVRGEDRYRHFESVPRPTIELDAEPLKTHERIVALYRDTYYEQEPLHTAMFEGQKA